MAHGKKTRLYGSESARNIHRACPPIDMHADPLMWVRWIGYDLTKRHHPPLPNAAWLGHVDLPRLNDAGVGAQIFGLVSLPIGKSSCFRAVMEQITLLKRICRQHPELIVHARTAEVMIDIRISGRVAALLGVEGAHALDGDLNNFHRLAEAGVKLFGLAHFSANEACCPSGGVGKDDSRGLTDFGRALVGECEKAGVIVDLAHINRAGFMEVCRMSRQPAVVSHTGVCGVHPHWRNIDDEQLRAVADTGGVVGIIFAPVFLGGDGVEAVVRHVEHVINTVGEDHVALGSDYDGMVTPATGLKEVSMLPNLTDAFLARKWSFYRIYKILRRNVLRVINDVDLRQSRS